MKVRKSISTVKGNSLPEVVVSLVILSLCSALFFRMMAQISKSHLFVQKFEAMQVAQKYFNLVQVGTFQVPFSEQNEFFFISATGVPDAHFQGCKSIVISVENDDNRIVYELEGMICDNEK